MRKFFWLFLIPVIFLTGCRRTSEAMPVSENIELIQETAPETAPLSIAERAELYTIPEMPHIYDECGGLSETERELHNSYLEELACSRFMNTFVVLTDNLNGNTPEQFAQEYYQTIADTDIPDGFLLLINNDTNQDYLYTTGRASRYILQSEAEILLSGATYQLIEGNYSDALSQILPVAEAVPAYLCDWTGTLTEEEIQEFSAQLQAIQSEQNFQCAVLLLPFPDAAELDAEAYLHKFNADAILLFDPIKRMCLTAGATEIQDSEIIQVLDSQGLYWSIKFFFENI